LLEEGAERGISYIIRLSAEAKSPSGASALEVARYVAKEFPEPKFTIEVNGHLEGMLMLAKAVRDVVPERKVILGGLSLDEVSELAAFPEALSVAEGICVDVNSKDSARGAIKSVKSIAAQLSEKTGTDLGVYINVQGGPTSPDEGAWFLTKWTIEAALNDVTLLWWHATRGEQPFFAFFRGEEPTLPAYALRLLATLLPPDAEEIPASEMLKSVPGTEIRCIRASTDRKAPNLIAVFPDGSGKAPAKFDLKTTFVNASATFVDVVAGTAQDAKAVNGPSGTVIPNVVWGGRPILLSIRTSE
jgi:hypothetical protein